MAAAEELVGVAVAPADRVAVAAGLAGRAAPAAAPVAVPAPVVPAVVGGRAAQAAVAVVRVEPVAAPAAVVPVDRADPTADPDQAPVGPVRVAALEPVPARVVATAVSGWAQAAMARASVDRVTARIPR